MSRKSSETTPTFFPRPPHSGHAPRGSLNEYAIAPPAGGLPARENSRRSTPWMSVTVPTVECDPPPSRFWSTITAMVRFSIASASGCGYFGRKLRMNSEKFS